MEEMRNDTEDNTDENKFTTKVISQNITGKADTLSTSTTSPEKTTTFGIQNIKAFEIWCLCKIIYV